MLSTRRLLAAVLTAGLSTSVIGFSGAPALADLLPAPLATALPTLPGDDDGGDEPLIPLPDPTLPLPGGGGGDDGGSGSGGSDSGSGGSGSGGSGSGTPAPKPSTAPKPKSPQQQAEDKVLQDFESSPTRYTDDEAPIQVVQATLAVQRIDALISFYSDRLAKDREGLTTAQTWLASAPSLGALEQRYAELTAQLDQAEAGNVSALQRAGLAAQRLPVQMQVDLLRTKLAQSKTDLPVLQKRIPESEKRLAQLAPQRLAALAALRAAAPTDLQQNQTRLLASGQLATQIRALSGKLRRNGASVDGTGDFARPALGRVTSPYGYRHHPILGYRKMHTGIDIARGDGFIYSADKGVVLMTVRNGGYGLLTVVDHGKIAGRRITTLYAHQSGFLVEPGQQVSKGQRIGRIGSTGLSTGPHLHFEVRDDGGIVNPHPWLRKVL